MNTMLNHPSLRDLADSLGTSGISGTSITRRDLRDVADGLDLTVQIDRMADGTWILDFGDDYIVECRTGEDAVEEIELYARG